MDNFWGIVVILVFQMSMMWSCSYFNKKTQKTMKEHAAHRAKIIDGCQTLIFGEKITAISLTKVTPLNGDA